MADLGCLVRKQDLPPPGGYKPIRYKRIPAAKLFNGYVLFAAYALITTGGLYLYALNNRMIKKREIELRSSKMAIYPMLLAERDREYMKQLRRNRDEEERLMANVEGWEVGTYYGEKIFETIPDDYLVEPIFHEYYAHASPSEWFKRAHFKFWT